GGARCRVEADEMTNASPQTSFPRRRESAQRSSSSRRGVVVRLRGDDAAFRLQAGGLIDRGRALAFSFDGRTYQGHPGGTLAAALLANGVHLVGRSFKYHRPRGILTAGPEEPNALVELRT